MQHGLLQSKIFINLSFEAKKEAKSREVHYGGVLCDGL
jgi:hypothetical protein